MFGLFPCSWSLPKNKPVKKLADNYFVPRTARILAPVQAPRTTPVNPIMPIEECCLGEVNDFTEIDRMLYEMDNPTEDAKTRQILQTIQMVNDNLAKNINAIENTPAAENSNLTNGDVVKLLKHFVGYSRSLEIFIKEIKPSSSSFSQY